VTCCTGKHTYGELANSPERIPTNILADRLKRLEAAGIIVSTPYQKRPTRYAYTLTPKGTLLVTCVLAFVRWGKQYIPGTVTLNRNVRPADLQLRHRPHAARAQSARDEAPVEDRFFPMQEPSGEHCFAFCASSCSKAASKAPTLRWSFPPHIPRHLSPLRNRTMNFAQNFERVLVREMEVSAACIALFHFSRRPCLFRQPGFEIASLIRKRIQIERRRQSPLSMSHMQEIHDY